MNKPEQADPTFEPHDTELEQALLGAVIQNPGLIPQIAQVVEDWHFYDPLHQRIFAQIIEWSLVEDRPISALTLSAAMKADPGIASIQIGRDYFLALESAAPIITSPKAIAQTIRDLAQRRDALGAMDVARKELMTSPIPVRDALRNVVTVADEAERLAVGARFRSTADEADEVIRDAERVSNNGAVTRAVRTGIKKLDWETGGFQGADYVVLAGKSGMGKSALMCGMSWRAASLFYPVIFFSLEMKRKQCVRRILTDIDFDRQDVDGHIQYRKFRSTGMSAEGAPNGFTTGEFHRLVLAKQQLQQWPWLEIHDEDGLTMAQIGARARAFQAKWRDDPAIREGQQCQPGQDPIGLVVIDYIQIVDPASRQYRPREQEVAGIARSQKALAKNLDWAVMAGSQLNEDDKGRSQEQKRPQPGDVRESKAIFHECDIMIAPYRPAYYVWQRKPEGAFPGDPAWVGWNGDLQRVKNQLDLMGLKNREGRTFDLSLFAEIGANAIRDEQPVRRHDAELADDMIGNFRP